MSSPTQRAPDAGDSGAISSIFLRLSIFPIGRRSAARPSAGNANRWGLKMAINGYRGKPKQIEKSITHEVTNEGTIILES